jgi:hypothetical protein
MTDLIFNERNNTRYKQYLWQNISIVQAVYHQPLRRTVFDPRPFKVLSFHAVITIPPTIRTHTIDKLKSP